MQDAPTRLADALGEMSADIKKARIILVDDHAAMLRQTLQLLPERFEVEATLEDGLELQGIVRNLQPDLIVLDITLPMVNGVQLARQLRADDCKSKIVFLTVHADADYVREAFSVGALGYVVKQRLASDLVPALDAALACKRFISPCPELAEFK